MEECQQKLGIDDFNEIAENHGTGDDATLRAVEIDVMIEGGTIA